MRHPRRRRDPPPRNIYAAPAASPRDASADYPSGAVAATRVPQDPEVHFKCVRLTDGRGAPLRIRDVDDSMVLRSQLHTNGCLAFNLLFRLRHVCAKTFVVVAMPGNVDSDALLEQALRLADVAASRVRAAIGGD